ncbi:hypothetical protein FPV67DRAFT_426060 [Lyophyllum atratum]|nr:hypothetical protein FPV67DRAFT_426060 [Lyophyllum atratum]
MISAAAVREPASCPPQTAMSRHEQERGYFTAETRQDATNAQLEDVLSSASEDEGGVGWDMARDNETLGYFNYNRWNLVLDSENPDCAPHIVITPSEETWEDQYTSWQNRVDMQWPGYLMVPRLDTSSGRLPTLQPISRPLPSLPTLPPSLNDSFPPVLMFSPSRFQKSIESAAVERLVLTQVVKILQKALCKAAFFDASSLARSCRQRYDAVSSILLDIEPVFTWSDPAEPILAASQRHFGTIILDSTCPFRAPHIVISAPPPQLPQVTENNATPYTQDAGFGQRLIVRSYSVDIINAVEDWDDSSVYDDASSDVDVDLLESECASRPGTPTPETPVDEDGDHDFFYVRHGDEGQDDTGIVSVYSSVCGFDSHTELHTEIEAGVAKLQATSRPMFFIDEDEDDLPSLDDW